MAFHVVDNSSSRLACKCTSIDVITSPGKVFSLRGEAVRRLVRRKARHRPRSNPVEQTDGTNGRPAARSLKRARLLISAAVVDARPTKRVGKHLFRFGSMKPRDSALNSRATPAWATVPRRPRPGTPMLNGADGGEHYRTGEPGSPRAGAQYGVHRAPDQTPGPDKTIVGLGSGLGQQASTPSFKETTQGADDDATIDFGPASLTPDYSYETAFSGAADSGSSAMFGSHRRRIQPAAMRWKDPNVAVMLALRKGGAGLFIDPMLAWNGWRRSDTEHAAPRPPRLRLDQTGLSRRLPPCRRPIAMQRLRQAFPQRMVALTFDDGNPDGRWAWRPRHPQAGTRRPSSSSGENMEHRPDLVTHPRVRRRLQRRPGSAARGAARAGAAAAPVRTSPNPSAVPGRRRSVTLERKIAPLLQNLDLWASTDGGKPPTVDHQRVLDQLRDPREAAPDINPLLHDAAAALRQTTDHKSDQATRPQAADMTLQQAMPPAGRDSADYFDRRPMMLWCATGGALHLMTAVVVNRAAPVIPVNFALARPPRANAVTVQTAPGSNAEVSPGLPVQLKDPGVEPISKSWCSTTARKMVEDALERTHTSQRLAANTALNRGLLEVGLALSSRWTPTPVSARDDQAAPGAW